MAISRSKSLSKSIPGRNDPLKGVYKSAFNIAKSGARLAIMNPYVSTTLGIAGFLSGRTSRNYAKASKVGTGRNLANKKITKSVKTTATLEKLNFDIEQTHLFL